jgi:hypothetical protein
MKNPNPECPREDCRFAYGGGSTTLVAYIPIYDRMGCKNCWWRAEKGEVMKPICPECGEQLYAYYVRKEDL